MGRFVYEGKTALVTGASSGIGEAFARELARRGADVVLVARLEGKLRALAEDLRREHLVRSEVVAADLSQERVVAEIKGEVERRGLAVDVLVNNAGFATQGFFEELDAGQDRKQVAVDVAAVVDMAHAFLPGMVARGGGAGQRGLAGRLPGHPLSPSTARARRSYSPSRWPSPRSTGDGACGWWRSRRARPRRPSSTRSAP
jgi:NADP-dependent 3-hydroxy acid dehydrogenase YdfG